MGARKGDRERVGAKVTLEEGIFLFKREAGLGDLQLKMKREYPHADE
ncbi:hypothetical protein KAX17_11295 [Candidatus Bipolaricaulota bacterium]|nr:hypothetical protein [Candidatus Bipolaricaulota bacterium]